MTPPRLRHYRLINKDFSMSQQLKQTSKQFISIDKTYTAIIL